MIACILTEGKSAMEVDSPVFSGEEEPDLCDVSSSEVSRRFGLSEASLSRPVILQELQDEIEYLNEGFCIEVPSESYSKTPTSLFKPDSDLWRKYTGHPYTYFWAIIQELLSNPRDHWLECIDLNFAVSLLQTLESFIIPSHHGLSESKRILWQMMVLNPTLKLETEEQIRVLYHCIFQVIVLLRDVVFSLEELHRISTDDPCIDPQDAENRTIEFLSSKTPEEFLSSQFHNTFQRIQTCLVACLNLNLAHLCSQWIVRTPSSTVIFPISNPHISTGLGSGVPEYILENKIQPGSSEPVLLDKQFVSSGAQDRDLFESFVSARSNPLNSRDYTHLVLNFVLNLLFRQNLRFGKGLNRDEIILFKTIYFHDSRGRRIHTGCWGDLKKPRHGENESPSFTLKAFIENHIHNGHAYYPLFVQNPALPLSLITLLTSEANHHLFPPIRYSRYNISFKNGIYDTRRNIFTPFSESPYFSSSSRVFIPENFDPSWLKCPIEDIPTPTWDKVFHDQGYDTDDIILICAVMGRSFFPVREFDSWGCAPYFIGKSSTGKSTLCTLLRLFFPRTKVVSVNSSASEEKFGLSTKSDAWCVFFEEFRGSGLGADQLLAILTGEFVELCVKYGEPKYVKWRVPCIFNSNTVPDNWVKEIQGLMTRIIPVFFETPIPKNRQDGNLLRNLEKESPSICAKLVRSYWSYVDMINSSGRSGTRVSAFLTPRMTENTYKFMDHLNPLAYFISMSPDVLLGEEYEVEESVFRDQFYDYHRNKRKANRNPMWDDSLTASVFEHHNIKREERDSKTVLLGIYVPSLFSL